MSDSIDPTHAAKCTACGAGLTAGELTCGACGAAVPGAEEPAEESAETSEPAPMVGSQPSADEQQSSGPLAWMNQGSVPAIVLKWLAAATLVSVLGMVVFIGFVAAVCRGL